MSSASSITTAISKVKLKNSLKTHTITETLLQDICDQLKAGIPFIEKLRCQPELTELVANIVWNSVPSSQTAIDKENLALQILTKIFDLDAQEIDTVKSQIQYGVDNGLIRTVPLIQRTVTRIFHFFLKKLGLKST